MCGIVAAIIHRSVSDDAPSLVQRACERMLSRGPDARGTWSENGGQVVLGHRRLAVLDPDPRSNQPMHTADGRHAIVFNGEIYNFRELRRELEAAGERFATTGDTEVILRLYAREGERMLRRLRGMFALAIWDRQEQALFCARDPYGIKPLYIAAIPGGHLVASQVKALLATGQVSREPDPLGQAGFWLLGSVPEPHTWFRDIRAVPAGSWCRLSADGSRSAGVYRDLGDSWRAPPQAKQRQEVLERVRESVKASVKCHLVADVPVGVLLSGGIDSGSLVGHMRALGQAQLQAVTLAFKEFRGGGDDEVPAATQIARRYGVAHHVRTVERSEFEAELPRIIAAMDQPSIDGFNTWFASKAVAELGLKVVLSGVGGDELFFGYPSFRQVPSLVRRWRQLGRIPGGQALARMGLNLQARRSGNSKWKQLPACAQSMSGAYFLRRALYPIAELPALMGTELAHAAAAQLSPQSLIEGMTGVLPDDAGTAVAQMESLVYLRNQLLRDSDWASMAHSVELRTPLVDAWLLEELAPVMHSFLDYSGKRLLALSPDLPLEESIIRRRKSGFGLPMGAWLGQTAVQGSQASKRLASRVVAEIYGG